MRFSSEVKVRFMAAALAESRKALPACRPNPPVGCIIISEDEIVSRGFTGAPGAPHAEASSIASLSYTGIRSHEGLSQRGGWDTVVAWE